MNVPKEISNSQLAVSPAVLLSLQSGFIDLIRSALKDKDDRSSLMEKAVHELTQALSLERCAVLLFSEGNSSLEVKAESSADGKTMLLGKSYQLSPRSEFVKLLKDGRPLPLQNILEGGASELASLVSGSAEVAAFPLVGSERLLGCLTMHTGQHLGDQLIDALEPLAQQLAVAIDVSVMLKTRDRTSAFFADAESACLIIDRDSLVILNANQSAMRLLAGGNSALAGLNLGDLLSPKTAVAESIKSTNQHQVAMAADLTAASGKSNSGSLGLLAYPIADATTSSRQALTAVILHRQTKSGESAKVPSAAESESPLGNQATLSRQLTWERWMRQIVCRVHSSLDRDSIMQSVVDSLGRALGVSRCMVVRTESVTAPIVTHEFAEPDVSPLGLGRTGQFPARTAGHFKTRVKSVADIVAERPNLQISDEELEWFLDNGFSSIAGAPISHHGHIYGVVVAISCGAPRKWLANELDMIEVAAAEAAVALENSQAFMQVKDQLFNMNLLGNLTQQLTNTLEMASRTTRPEGLEDKGRADTGGPPLSFRELEVLKLIASGLANREIAQRLFLTESTVELHASRIRKKLKLKSRTALVKYACDNDLV
ncbi:MAG: hypothetical protein C0507_21280 [Cyanobacteria bacterium PR.3.49]|nr:hypothetical protein [Cyanobacteria bacterium PR.3.49]